MFFFGTSFSGKNYSLYLVIFILLLAPQNPLFAQYFQQHTDYKIFVNLDDQNHTLDAFEQIDYTNNSPDTLHFLWFHLYPNAYQNNRTAFAQQKIQNKEANFFHSNPENRGYIDKLDFRVDGQPVSWNLDSVNIDICQIHLKQPLLPGQSIKITTPFFVKIPLNYSRLGHQNQSYQISQWYPKPAVYDANGWHPMPYLDQGEFYSEWGSFEVKITLPSNYVVGATGYLQEASEIEWLEQKINATQQKAFDKSVAHPDFPPSDTTYKVITYKIDSVHDFAWFADKRFHVLKDTLTLPNGNTIDAVAMFTDYEAPLWKNATQYIREALLFYSENVGNYPYKICTAVQGALMAGGGMEYPTITIIGKSGNAENLENVIVHEVGHNWFQGMLASNERKYPWMDEGINSYYENRFLQKKYPEKTVTIGSKNISRFLGISQQKFHSSEWLKIAYEVKGSFRKSQAINLSSEQFTAQNFGIIAYGKTAWAFDYLNAYLGDSIFDITLKTYFQKYAFKHPQPDDLQELFEYFSAKKLDWFFKEHFHESVDQPFKIKVKKIAKSNRTFEVKIINKHDATQPVSIGTYDPSSDTLHTITWWQASAADTTLLLEKSNRKTHFCLDCPKNKPTIFRANYYHRKPLKLKFLAAYDSPNQRELFFLPWYNWNNYDKSMLGVAIYNHTLFYKKLSFEIVPQYAFNTKTVVGMGNIAYTFFSQRPRLQYAKLSVQGRRFSWSDSPIDLAYSKLQPTLEFELKPANPRSHKLSSIVIRNLEIWQQLAVNEQNTFKSKQQHYYLNEFAYHFKNNRLLYPFNASGYLQQSNDFIKLFSTAQFQVNLNKKNDALHIRLFAGVFLWDNQNSGTLPDARFRLNFSSGFSQFIKDYTFDEFLLGRSNTGGFTSRQIVSRDGGFKNLTALGQTNDWLSAINLALDVPVIPFQIYMNIAAYGDNNDNFNAALEGGFTLYAIRDVLAFHFPLFSSIQANFGSGNETISWSIFKSKNNTNNPNFGISYRKLISFNFDLVRLHPFEKLKEQVY